MQSRRANQRTFREGTVEQLPGAIKGLLIICIIIAVIVAIPVLFVGYWYVTLPITALIIGGVVYMKKQKAQANRV